MARTWMILLSALLCLTLPASAWADDDEPPADKPIGGQRLEFTSADGVKLIGHLWQAQGEARGSILFVHEPFRSQRDWAYLAEKMSRRGFSALIFDLRGHGDSLMQGDEELDRELFGQEEFQAMTQDVSAALAVLAKHAPGGKNVHVIGADLGSSLALLQANAAEEIDTVAMISPGLGYDEVNIVGQAASFNRPLLLVYSVEDSYSRKSAEVLAKEARGPIHTEVYYGVGHGTKMLSREPALESFLQSWFLGTVITPEGRSLADTGKPEAGEKGVEGGIDAEAEKRKLQEQRDAVTQGAVKDEEGEQGKKLGSPLDKERR